MGIINYKIKEMSSEKLKKIGSSILWFIALCIFLAQGYRAVAYYVFDQPIEWTWHDLVVFGMAFMAMFVPAELKSIVVSTAKRVASRK